MPTAASMRMRRRFASAYAWPGGTPTATYSSVSSERVARGAKAKRRSTPSGPTLSDVPSSRRPQDRLHDRRAGDLAQSAPGGGLPRQQRALAVHQEEDRARRDLGRLRELLEPGEVEQRVDDAAHGVALAEDGISEGEGGPRRDSARLDGTDGERARAHDLADERPRVRVFRRDRR